MIVFSHANSFPAGTYGVLFDRLRKRGHDVRALPMFGHDSRYPVTDNWPNLVQQLADFAAPQMAQRGQGAWLVGHSFGGFLSLMCAALHPRLGGQPVRGVLLLDAPVLAGRRALLLRFLKKTPFLNWVSPGTVSQRRRRVWPSADEALVHFQSKPAFARWPAQVLKDYVLHGIEQSDSAGCALRFDPVVETQIYNAFPHHLQALLKRHPLPCPLGFIGGQQSAELRQVGMAFTRRLIGADHPERLRMTEGGHLFPMEHPHTAAVLIEAVLQSMG